jgi:tRNA-specific 2-thiouridylase
MRVVTAMSGGVDSSVAAALLVDEGYEVVGLSMQLYDQREGGAAFGSCCTIDDLQDARRVASVIGIPHYIVNFEKQFEEHVISKFVQDYTAARTPIPCVSCNSNLKFLSLLNRARGLNASSVATGHYARVEKQTNGRFALKRGIDQAKDQSYFLFTLTQEQLSCALFPLGSLSKDQVRAYAASRKLPVASKPDSHEICFVPDNDYASFVERRAPHSVSGGNIKDMSGNTLGSHEGIHRFTVGQRKGLGLSGPEPIYVVALDAEKNTVTVGPRRALQRSTLTASEVNWISGYAPAESRLVTARIRHHHPEASATVLALEENRIQVNFESPQPAITPGQAVVLYDGDEVLGGGWID